MKKNKINTYIIAFEVFMILLSIIFLYIVNSYNHHLYKFSNDRLHMIQTADKLRQSSDDLTHFARTYVVTANEEYKKQYFETLDIRNGDKKRPLLYSAIYWDLEKNIREKKHPDTKRLSLKEIFSSLPYTKNELKKLELSEKNSNKLVNLEVEAFNAMTGLYKDPSGNYTIKKEPNQNLAITLLHSKEYYHAKHLIMNPIDDFMIMLEKRTKEEIEKIHSLRDSYFYIFLASILLFILGNIYIYAYLNHQDKEAKKHLQKKIDEAIDKTKKQESLLLKQEKYVALSEMMDAIAHQWKQPLSIISVNVDSLLFKFPIEQEDVTKASTNVKEQINHLSTTIDEFRQFFRPNQNLQEVDLLELLESTLGLMKTELVKKDIEVSIDKKAKVLKKCLPNEFKHIFINLINNTADAYIENNLKNRTIVFSFVKKEDSLIIKCQDQAGGIPDNILEKVFESNFTTKEEGKGTGIGLYLTKQIVEKHNGKIKVENKNGGACFTITL